MSLQSPIYDTANVLPMSPESLLGLIPHKPPFRFVDEILEIDDDHIVGRYRFRLDEPFYAGHFPADPVTPGAILLETMAQIGAVGLLLFLAAQDPDLDEKKLTPFFTEAQIDFSGAVRPGDRVTVHAQKIYFRRHKLKVSAEMRLDDGTVVCWGEIAGMGVIK